MWNLVTSAGGINWYAITSMNVDMQVTNKVKIADVDHLLGPLLIGNQKNINNISIFDYVAIHSFSG